MSRKSHMQRRAQAARRNRTTTPPYLALAAGVGVAFCCTPSPHSFWSWARFLATLIGPFLLPGIARRPRDGPGDADQSSR